MTEKENRNGTESVLGLSHNFISSLDGLVFPIASQNISKISASLSKSTLSIRNRLNSINEDASFVNQATKGLVSGCEPCQGLPVVANERCGGWYVDPALKVNIEHGSCYFKSTDGHFVSLPECKDRNLLREAKLSRKQKLWTWVVAHVKITFTESFLGLQNQWNFSLRRLNLHILDIVVEHGGCIIVDSTRRGKHLPDALSKTIPIWCSVMNRLLFPSPDYASSHGFERLAEIISTSEQAQIEARLSQFVEEAQKLNLSLDDLRTKLQRPLKPIWIARSLGLPHEPPDPMQSQKEADQCYPIYLCTASRFQSSLYDESSSGYVQGAGDDNESWSCGLTSAVYWANRELLLAASEDELPELIEECMARDAERRSGTTKSYPNIPHAPWLRIGTLPANEADMAALMEKEVLVISCAPESWNWPGVVITAGSEGNGSKVPKDERQKFLHLHCGPGKLGSRDLRKELVKVPEAFEQYLRNTSNSLTGEGEANGVAHGNVEVIVCCPTGKDLAVGVALALLCLCTDNEGALISSDSNLSSTKGTIDKAGIKKKLSWIVSALPAANPARATLNSVNAFLMS